MSDLMYLLILNSKFLEIVPNSQITLFKDNFTLSNNHINNT